MKTLEIIKKWNPNLYYAMLDWKDRNGRKFQQVTETSKSPSLGGCTDAELQAIIILLVNEVTKFYKEKGKLPVIK